MRAIVLGAGTALALAAIGWWQFAGTDGSVEAATPVMAAVLGIGLLALTFVAPWGAAGRRWSLIAALWIGTLSGSAIAAISGWGAPGATSLTILAAYAVVSATWTAAVGAMAWAGTAWGLHRATAQAIALGLGLLACTTPMYAEPLVAMSSVGAVRGWLLIAVTGANPLLVTGGSILGWDVWHQPYLYGVSDVAAYGFPHAQWGWASLSYALWGGAAAGAGVWGARRRAAAAPTTVAGSN